MKDMMGKGLNLSAAAKRRSEMSERDDKAKATTAKMPASFKQPMCDLFGMLRAQSLMFDLNRYTDEDDDRPICCGYYGHDSDLAHKIVGMFGKQAIDTVSVGERMVACLKDWSNDTAKSEEAVLAAVQALHAKIKDESASLGLDNLLRKIADEHENALYKA